MSVVPDLTAMHAFAFGDSPHMADELLAAVLSGAKTAACTSLRDFRSSGDPLPEVGRRDVVLDGAGKPAAIIETTSVEFLPFEEVPLEYAVHAGEGWETIDDWRQGYRAYLARNGGFEPGIEMLCERFRLVEALAIDTQEDRT